MFINGTVVNSYDSDDTQQVAYSKTCVKRPLSKRPKIVFQYQLSLNAGQMEIMDTAQCL